MLQLFRRNLVLNSLLLLPYVLIVHGGRFFINYGQEPIPNDWIYSKLLYFSGISDSTQYYLALLIVFFQSLFINKFINFSKLNQSGQLFGGLVFIILTGFHPMLFSLSGILIGTLFFILAISSIIRIYLQKSASIQIFNYGFFIGLATMFYSPYVWMLILGLLGLTVFRGLTFRDLLQMLVGFVCVFFFLSLYLYYTNQGTEYINSQWNELFSPYVFSMKYSGKGLVAFAIIITLLLLSLIRFNLFQSKLQISVKKVLDLLFWACLVSFLSILFVRISHINHLIILLVPLAVFLSIILAKIKSELQAETLHLFFALFALFLQLQNW